MYESSNSAMTGFLLALVITATVSLSGRLYYERAQEGLHMAAAMTAESQTVACR